MIRVQLPRLLNADLTENARLSPVAASLTLQLKGAANATLTLPDDSPEVAVHDWISVYTQRGFNGVYRVNNVVRNYKRQTEISLLHGIDILADSVWQEQKEFSGTVDEFLEDLLAQQTHLINGVKPWVLGECEDTSEYKKTINYDRLSNLMDDLIEDGGTYYFVYDQTSFPWTVSLVERPEGAAGEFRLARNARSATVTYNDADLCTRLILSDNHKTKEADEAVKTNKSIILTYNNSAAQAEWGIVIKTADIDTQDDIEGGDYSEADAWAADFLAKRAEPTVQIQIDGDELCALTGDTWDEVSIGKMCRVALPAYNRTFTERVISVTYSDLLGKPDHVTVALANALPQFSENITKLQDEVKKVSAGGAGGARKAADSEELEYWGKTVTYYGEALDGTGVLTLYQSGIDMDPAGGVKIFSLQEGLRSLYSSIEVQTNRISLVVDGEGTSASINIEAITDAINQSRVTISADRIDLQGYVTASQLSVTDAKIENLIAGNTQATMLWANSMRTASLSVGATSYGASALTIDGVSSGSVLTSSGDPVSISHGYFTGCTKSTSGDTVTLTFTKGVGDPVVVSFDRGGQASGVSLSAAGNVREAQGAWVADTTVTLNGTTATKTLNVDTVFNQGYSMGSQTGYTTGYAAGWAAARAKSSFAWSGSNENVLSINRPGAAIDTSEDTVVYSIGSYKASGDRLYNSAANYFTYSGVVYTTVTPQNDPEHTGQWTPSTVNVNRSQYIDVGQ